MRIAVMAASMACIAGNALAAEPAAPVLPCPCVSPKILKNAVLDWPGDADREALVQLRLTISKEGVVTEAVPMEQSSFSERRFVDAAVRAAKGMRFTPATRSGEPVEVRAILPVVFGLGKGLGEDSVWAKGITSDFRIEMKKVNDLLKKGDYAGADFHAEWMLRETVRYGYEFAALKAELAQTHAAKGDDFQAIRYAEQATQRTKPALQEFALHQPIPPNSASNYLLPVAVVQALLQLRIQLNIKDGNLLEALKAYSELAGLVKIAPDDPRAVTMARITEKLDGKEPLLAHGRVQEGRWYHSLYRRNLQLQKVTGRINSLVVYCEQGKQVLKYAPGEVWSIPADWNNCEVVLTGEDGITFDLIESAD